MAHIRIITENDQNGWKNNVPNGATNGNCPICVSWEDHWKKFAKCELPECSNKDCHDKAVLATHLSRQGENGEKWIAPLCENCKNKTDEFSLDKGAILVNADINESCRILEIIKDL